MFSQSEKYFFQRFHHVVLLHRSIKIKGSLPCQLRDDVNAATWATAIVSGGDI